MSTYDAAIVLGGGVREGGELPPWAIARFETALALCGEAPIVCLSAGTVHHPPPLNEEGYPWLESVAGAKYLLSRGIAASRIQVEATSWDTIGNAYFAKLLHVDPAGWSRLLVVTSEFHMPRSRAIFEWVFGMEPDRYELQFVASPDVGMEPLLLDRRRAKEAAGIESLREITARLRDLPSLHCWLHSEHAAYSPTGWISRRASAPEVAEIY
jgi:hypothetical protein